MTVETGTQTPSTVITPVMKKKSWTWKLMVPYHQLVREEEEEEVEECSQKATPLAKKWEEVTETTQEKKTSLFLERTSRHAERLQLPDK